MKLLQFGAGRIGRSFIGQLFSRAGWDVVFAEKDPALTALLNERKSYRLVIKRDGREDEERLISNIRAVAIDDEAAVLAETVDADLIATSVGQRAFDGLLPLLAAGLEKRFGAGRQKPVSIILAENAREAPAQFRSFFAKAFAAGPGGEAARELIGLVETSIGKMVPLVPRELLALDPLLLFGEEYETLIVDRDAFRGPIPQIPGLKAVSPISAWVDRKLFVHNLGHAAAAYLGFKADPSAVMVDQGIALAGVEEAVRRAMGESAAALIAAYPRTFTGKDLEEHINDLVFRFKNRALEASIYWAGRDIPRKLSKADRITGAMLLCAKQNRPFNGIAGVYQAALDFAKGDENGELFPEDAGFRRLLLEHGKDWVYREISGLEDGVPEEKRALDVLRTKF